MSAHNHDTEDPTIAKYGKIKPIKDLELTAEEERIGGYIRVWGVAKNKSLKDFINWCSEQDYTFNTPS